MTRPYRSCSCREPGEPGKPGRLLGKSCPKLEANSRHGKWYVRFEAPPDPGGKRRQPRLGPYGSEKEAKDALTDALGDVRSGVLADDRQTTLAAYLARWLEGQQLARKRRTYESYADAVRLYWAPALGHVRLAQLREQHVLDTHKAMRKLNTPAEAGDRSELLRRLAAARATVAHLPDRRVRTAPLTETTIQRATAVLRAALNDCKALKANPAAGIELRVPKRKPVVWTAERVARWRQSGGAWRPGPVMVWTPAQTGAFLDAIESDRMYPLYHLAAFTGLRRAELAGLPWSETDLDAGLITVRETRPDDDVDAPKSETGERTVALSADTRRAAAGVAQAAAHRAAGVGRRVDRQRPGVHPRGWPAVAPGLPLRVLPAAGPPGKLATRQTARFAARRRHAQPRGRRRHQDRQRDARPLH